MHELAPLITDLAVILSLAGVVMLLCQKLKQPLVLGYLLAGVIVGPYTPPYHLITDTGSIQTIAELGVIFLMFSLGLEFSFHKLMRLGAPASITGTVEVVVMMAIGFALGEVLGWPKMDSLFLGAALAISSTTIIIKALSELKLKRTYFAELVFGVLIVEDLLAILLLVGLSTFVTNEHALNTGFFLSATLRLVLVVGSWFLIGYFLVPTLFRKWLKSASSEVLIVVSVALCLVLVNAAAQFHYSVALGAFIMGSILAETDEVERIEHLVQPLRDIFAAVFFVSVGMLLNPMQIWDHIGVVLIISIVTIVGKIFSSFLGAVASRAHPLTALQVGFSMAQIGEFSFIIAGLGVALGAVSDTFYPLIVAVSAITTFTTPYLIQFSYRGIDLIEKRLKAKGKVIQMAQRQVKLKEPKNLHLRGYLIRLILNAMMVTILFTFLERQIWPLVFQWEDLPFRGAVMVYFITYIVTAPFIYAMIFSCQITTNAEPKLEWVWGLKIFAFAVTVLEMYLLIDGFFGIAAERLWLVLCTCILTFMLKVPLHRIYFWFENRLRGNIKQAA